jgi:hypothetical protein
MFQHWWRRWLRSQTRSSRWGRPRSSKRTRRPALTVEALETRTLLSFAGPVAFNLGAAPNAVAVGHFEGASAPLDVVTANANGTLSVLLGKGDGTVQNPILLTLGATPVAVTVGDVLGNGLQDIVTANSNGTVSVLLSNGNGTFKAPETISLGVTPTGIAVGDFNRDGHLDIVTANTNGTVSVTQGNGDGTFRAVISFAASGSLTSIAVADFNGDHISDLVVGTNSGLDILLGNGTGEFQLKQQLTIQKTFHGITFTTGINSVAVADLRGNGIEDVVGLGSDTTVRTFLGNGDGTVGQPVAVPAGGKSLVVADFNGDGKPDIVTSSYYTGGASNISVLTGNGDGTFSAAQTTTLGEEGTALATGDFRGDGKADLVLASNQGATSVTVLLGNGNGTFATAPTAPTTNLAPDEIMAADFNGDGKPDLVVASSGGIVVLLGNGDGTFRAGPTLNNTGAGDPIAVGDFNGDGKPDIAASTVYGVDIFFGNGNGTFKAAKQVVNLGTSDTIESMVAGDFVPGSGLDLAVVAHTPQNSVVRVLLNNGNGTFTKGQTINVGTEARGLATADLNGDGKPDLVTTSFINGSGNYNVEVLLGNGNGTFRAPIITNPGGRSTSVVAGDFNGDGKQDLLLTDYFDNTVTVLPGNGNGTFGTPKVFQFHNSVQEVETPAVGDFFGDGKLSVAVSTGLGEVSVLRGNGDGTFQANVDYVGDFRGLFPAEVVAADFNGDGKLDLAATNFLSDDVTVLLNTSPAPAQNKVATTTVLSEDLSNSVFGQSVTLTATVTTASGTATGTVTFFDGSTSLGEVALDPNGQARLLVQLAPGTHALRATFAGIPPFQKSHSTTVTETVSQAQTTTTVGVSPFGSTGFESVSVTVAPVAPGAGTPTGTVSFFDGNTLIATVTLQNGQATFFKRFTSGTHTITADYSGDADFVDSISQAVTFTVP